MIAAPTTMALETDGFTVCPTLLAADEVDLVRACFDDLRTVGAPTTTQVLYTHEAPAVPRPSFDRLMLQWLNPHLHVGPGSTTALLKLVGHQLRALGFDLRPFQDVLLAKTAAHACFPWHQDEPFWPFDAAAGLVVWCALDPVDSTCGGLEFAPRSHLLGRGPAIDLHTGEPQAGAGGSIPDLDALVGVCPVLRPGDAVAFRPRTWHRSGRNISSAPRRGLVIVRGCRSVPRFKANSPPRRPLVARRRTDGGPAMMRLTWLVGPPGAGKSTFARQQRTIPRTVELNTMLGPLIDALRIRKGVLSANGALVQAVRHVELHPANAAAPELLVVAGLVPEGVLFPLAQGEEVLLLLPERTRWQHQLRSRPAGYAAWAQPDERAYAELWYERFEQWCASGLPIRRIETPFEERLIGQVGAC